MGNLYTVQLKRPEKQQEFLARAAFELKPYTHRRAIAVNLEETKQELDSLFETKMYERPYQPDYYNPLEELLGELWTDDMETSAIQLIEDKVNRFIPYITIDQNRTVFNYSTHLLKLELVFSFENDFSNTLYSYERDFTTVT